LKKYNKKKNSLYTFFLKMKSRRKEFKKGWFFLYKKRSKLFKYFDIARFRERLNDIVNARHIKKRKKNLKAFNKYKKKINNFGKKKKKDFEYFKNIYCIERS